MRKTMRIAGSLLLSWLISGSAISKSLELPAIGKFRVEADPDSSKIKLSGTCLHSAYVVKNLKTKQRGSDLLVTINITMMTKGRSPDFQYEVSLADNVKRVVLGKDMAVVWSR